MGLSWLERSAVKVARSVLRRVGGGDPAHLSDKTPNMGTLKTIAWSMLMLMNPSDSYTTTLVTVDSSRIVGFFSSLQLNSAGNPVISYYPYGP